MGENGGAAAEAIVGSATDAAGDVVLPSGTTHRRIAVDDWENIYVVGDVHGCIEELRALLQTARPER